MGDPSSYRRPVITLKEAAFRVRDRLILPGTSWEIKTGQNWAVVGPNGVGKTTLMRALTGDVPVVRGTIQRHYGEANHRFIGYVSFELHRDLIAGEEGLDAARDFSSDPDGMTTAGEIIGASAGPGEAGVRTSRVIVRRLGIEGLLEKGVRQLSTGEMRKVLIARALAKSPGLLILDEPFDGLDPTARLQLSRDLDLLIDGSVQIILVTHRPDEMLPAITHVLRLDPVEGAVTARRDRMPGNKPFAHSPRRPRRQSPVPKGPEDAALPEVLVEMRNVTVRYKGGVALRRLNWTMRQGENWAVVGPNGAGKTTLLRLIYADMPQAYANEIYLFGRKRGTGESIWDIRRRIGWVGSEFQIHYRKPITGFEVVLSGFFDTVGLYRLATWEQKKTARLWLAALGIDGLSDRPFDQLSYGQQRMVLMARAMVKSPPLLLLDEPCQGLDTANREKVLEMIDRVAARTRSHIVHVTHREEEITGGMTHILDLETGADGTVARVRSLTGEN